MQMLAMAVMQIRLLRCTGVWGGALGAALCVALGVAAMPGQAVAADAALQVKTPARVLNVEQLPWQAPAAARLEFDVRGSYKGFPYQTTARLHWLPSGQRYEAMQEVQVPLVGARRQASVGVLGAQGLLPQVFTDRGRRDDTTTFDSAAGTIRFSRGTDPAPWVHGTQDRLSVFFQMAGWLAAAAPRYPAGTLMALRAASNRNVAVWTFRVVGEERLQLPFGSMQAVRLERVRGKGGSGGDAGVSSVAGGESFTLWLAQELDYLPARMYWVEKDQEVTLQLQALP